MTMEFCRDRKLEASVRRMSIGCRDQASSTHTAVVVSPRAGGLGRLHEVSVYSKA